MAQLQSRAKSFGIIFSRQTSPGVPWPTAKRARTTFVAAERETEDARDESRALRAIDRRPLGRNVAQRRKMLKGEGSSTSCPGTRNKAAKEGSEAKDEREESEIENARRLDKLPQELWERIFDDLEENDLFPLALSCSLQVLSSEAEGAGGAGEAEGAWEREASSCFEDESHAKGLVFRGANVS